MSGISAILSLDGRPVPAEIAARQLAAVAHRGSEAPREWRAGQVALGHVNLPTTPEAEDELLPMASANGRHWLTWDGRLDNRAELQKILPLAPRNGARHVTDADLVLAAYAHWGEAFVDHLLGDWALVLWDAETQKLVCAKDPLGWRQLYFARADGLLFVGSEPQQLFAGGIVPRTVDHEFVLRFLAEAVQEPGTTGYAHVTALLGGQLLIAQDGELSLRTFWDRPRVRPRAYRSPQQYVEEFEAIFDLATAARLRSNRPLGVALSGGLDSSYVAAIAKQQGADPLAITIFCPGTKWMDEREEAGIVVDHLGLRQELIDLSDAWSLSSHHIAPHQFDQPSQPPQAPAHVLMPQRAAALGVGVMLGGEGADEWLTSFPTVADEVAYGRLGSAWQLARRSKHPARALVAGVYGGLVPFGLRQRARTWHLRGARDEFETIVPLRPDWQPIATYTRSAPRYGTERLRREWVIYRQGCDPVIGWRDRHAFAANGVELRTPFNDLRLVEFLASVPATVKRFRGRRKDILREAEYKVLPAVIPDRDDFGLYSELLEFGARHESERITDALHTLMRLDGVRASVLHTEAERGLRKDSATWENSWRAITAGAWLANLASPTTAGDSSVPLDLRIPIGKEVRTA